MHKTNTFPKKRLWPILLILLCLLTLATLLYSGLISFNSLFISNYSVRGIDVSSYQQRINWQSVARSGQYSFVFIKATEGETYRDPYFRANWRGARSNGLPHGAYHFYTPSLPGAAQADNFISAVPAESGMLPPVLDLEVSSQNRALTLREVKTFLAHLQERYRMQPIIYTDLARYSEYIKGNLENYPIWIGDALTPPQWSSINNWTFWQYSDRGHAPGISTFVDLDVFSGPRNKLLSWSSFAQFNFRPKIPFSLL
jgi:lysozyme